MAADHAQKIFCRIVEDQDFPLFRGIPRVFLLEHRDHHVVRGLVDNRNHDLLPVQGKVPRRIFCHGFLTDLKHVIPCHDLRKLISEFFHIGLIDIDRFRGTHEGNRILLSGKDALFEKLGNDLFLFHSVKLQLAAAEPVLFVVKELIQRNNHIVSGHIGGDVIGIGNADIRGGVGCDIGDDIVIDLAVIVVDPDIDMNIGIQLLEGSDRILVDPGLILIRIILCPEGQFKGSAFIQLFGNDKRRHSPRAMASAEKRTADKRRQKN